MLFRYFIFVVITFSVIGCSESTYIARSQLRQQESFIETTHNSDMVYSVLLNNYEKTGKDIVFSISSPPDYELVLRRYVTDKLNGAVGVKKSLLAAHYFLNLSIDESGDIVNVKVSILNSDDQKEIFYSSRKFNIRGYRAVNRLAMVNDALNNFKRVN